MLTTIVLFIVILGLLVFVHEFGHFITAKKLKTGVEEFGFGFPPRMIGIYKTEDGKWKKVFKKTPVFAKPEDGDPKTAPTIYSLNWIPLGGFVKIKGEDGSDISSDSFASKKIWERAVILVAGVTMNIILAIVILSIGFSIGLPRVLDDKTSGLNIKDKSVQIVSIVKGSSAYEAGLEPGDEILAVDGQPYNFEFTSNYLTKKVGEEVVYRLKRSGGDTFEKILIPQILMETGKGGVGVGIVEVGIVSYPWHQAIWKGLTETVYYVKEIAIAFLGLLKGLITGTANTENLSGPVGIAVLTGRVARLGFAYLMQFAAILSINLAIINIFPFPALDGGRLFFLLIEKIRGKAINQKIENIVNNLGFGLLMLLVVVITYKDFLKFGDRFSQILDKII